MIEVIIIFKEKDNMHVLVSGCSSGIGQSITRYLLQQGHEVTGLGRRQPPFEGAGFQWIPADLSLVKDIDNALHNVRAVDALVHAAGVMYPAPLGEANADQAQKMWQLHVAAPSHLMEGLVRREDGLSRVVLIGSRTMAGAIGKSAYAATKAAMQGLVRSWALELVARRVAVNLVAPAATDTPMLRDPARAGVVPRVPPMGQYIDPEDIAALVGFLLGPHGSAMTGQTLTVCGGASLQT